MSKKKPPTPAPEPEALFDRVASILEQARGNVVRAVNTNMVHAYWLIGREIVQELQGGKERAEYGKKVVEDLSTRLTEHYAKGYSAQTLWKFRLFYQAYPDRIPILSPPGIELEHSGILSPRGTELVVPQIPRPTGGEAPSGFSPHLTWSHYRALMRVDNHEARNFYEREAIEGGWDKRTLERQIQSFYYERMLNDRKQIFASRYMLFLPTEEQLRLEIEKERSLIESYLEERNDA